MAQMVTHTKAMLYALADQGSNLMGSEYQNVETVKLGANRPVLFLTQKMIDFNNIINICSYFEFLHVIIENYREMYKISIHVIIYYIIIVIMTHHTKLLINFLNLFFNFDYETYISITTFRKSISTHPSAALSTWFYKCPCAYRYRSLGKGHSKRSFFQNYSVSNW